MKQIIISVFFVLALIVGYGIWTNHQFSVATLLVEDRWKDVETVYEARFRFMPVMVSSVATAMKEEEALAAVTVAQEAYARATTTNGKVLAAGEVESAYTQLLLALENYTILEASSTIQVARRAVEKTEDIVADARTGYNEAVREYNRKVTGFPGSFVANLLGYDTKTYFQSADGI